MVFTWSVLLWFSLSDLPGSLIHRVRKRAGILGFLRGGCVPEIREGGVLWCCVTLRWEGALFHLVRTFPNFGNTPLGQCFAEPGTGPPGMDLPLALLLAIHNVVAVQLFQRAAYGGRVQFQAAGNRRGPQEL